MTSEREHEPIARPDRRAQLVDRARFSMSAEDLLGVIRDSKTLTSSSQRSQVILAAVDHDAADSRVYAAALKAAVRQDPIYAVHGPKILIDVVGRVSEALTSAINDSQTVAALHELTDTVLDAPEPYLTHLTGSIFQRRQELNTYQSQRLLDQQALRIMPHCSRE